MNLVNIDLVFSNEIIEKGNINEYRKAAICFKIGMILLISNLYSAKIMVENIYIESRLIIVFNK